MPGGYQALRKVLGKISPAEITETVKKSGLRGRGGAGFPRGQMGIPSEGLPGPRYLCCNADESEPGTFKDRQLIERDPHQMIEGMLIACYAIGVETAYIYIRGEFILGAQILERALAEARAAGYIGKNILGRAFDRYLGASRRGRLYLRRGDGLVGIARRQARLAPCQTSISRDTGLYNKPTVVNNVETLANLPHIINRGAEWFAAIGSPPKSSGTRIFCSQRTSRAPGETSKCRWASRFVN